MALQLQRWSRRDATIALAVAAAGVTVLLWRLGAGSLYDWDEATYAEISREIPIYHDWVHLHWNYEPWVNKPPLYIWLTALSFLAGVSEFTARVVSALAGAGVLVVTYILARRLYGALVAVAAVVILATCREFLAAGRFGTSDELLTLFLYLTLFFALLAQSGRTSWWFAAGISLGLAAMTKGFAALVAPPALALAMLLDGRAAQLKAPQPWLGLAAAALVAAPWHLAMLGWLGAEFVHQYFSYMVARRAAHPIEGHTGTLFFYAVQVRNQFYPWAYALPFAAAAEIAWLTRRRSPSSLVIVFAAVVLGVYTLIASKLFWYILPAYPALAILVAHAAIDGSRQWRYAPAVSAVVVLVALVSVPHVLPRLSPPVLLAAVALGALSAGTAWAIARGAARPPFSPAALAGAIALLTVLAVGGVRPLYELRQSPVVPAARAAGAHQGCCLYLFIGNAQRYSDDDISHSLVFYSHRPVLAETGTAGLQSVTSCPFDLFYKTVNSARIEADFALSVKVASPPWSYAQASPHAGCK